ncbi:MAG: sulfite exporter TauE/SafE family protein [Phycisphaerales bacterium]|jgi:hypothetical protein|nr:sulfite exporter TauE/SafE family protein [Phycisphaerales bacterium]
MPDDFVLALILMGLAGLFVGFISALLGIGGGMLMVPALYYLLGFMGIHQSDQMHVAAGTSLLIMIATSVGSVSSHARDGNVVWKMTFRVLPGIVVGVVAGALLASVLNTAVLVTVFAVVLFLVALIMIFSFKATPHERPIPGIPASLGVGSLIGFKSGLLGVGGGALSVPWLTWLGLPQNKVSGTSSTFTFPAAIVGTVAFLITGLGMVEFPYTIGFVFWPGLPVAGGASILATIVGARFASRVPGRMLRIIFGVLLVLVSISMMTS